MAKEGENANETPKKKKIETAIVKTIGLTLILISSKGTVGIGLSLTKKMNNKTIVKLTSNNGSDQLKNLSGETL